MGALSSSRQTSSAGEALPCHATEIRADLVIAQLKRRGCPFADVRKLVLGWFADTGCSSICYPRGRKNLIVEKGYGATAANHTRPRPIRKGG